MTLQYQAFENLRAGNSETLRFLVNSSKQVDSVEVSVGTSLDASSLVLNTRLTTISSDQGYLLSSGPGTVLIDFIWVPDQTSDFADIPVTENGVLGGLRVTSQVAGLQTTHPTLTIVKPAASTTLSVATVGTDVTVTLGTNSSGVVTSNISDVVNLINGDASAVAVLSATVSNTSSYTLICPESAQVTLLGGHEGNSSLTVPVDYCYKIEVTYSDGNTNTTHTGVITYLDPNSPVPTSTISGVKLLGSSSAKMNYVVDQLMGTILGTFKRICIWDEQIRRVDCEANIYQMMYFPINISNRIEVYDDQNNCLSPDKYTIECDTGKFTYLGTDCVSDLFVSYEFDLVPAEEMVNFVHIAVSELNVLGAVNGYQTKYTAVDDVPESLLGLIALGASGHAYQKLRNSLGLWKNYIMFVGSGPDGSSLDMASYFEQASSYYTSRFTELAQSAAQIKHIGKSTSAWSAFKYSAGNGVFGVFSPRFGTGNSLSRILI